MKKVLGLDRGHKQDGHGEGHRHGLFENSQGQKLVLRNAKPHHLSKSCFGESSLPMPGETLKWLDVQEP